MKPFLEFNNISHAYSKNRVLHNCSFDIKHGELIGLLGESGSGKTTILRLIAGFEHPQEGSIALSGQTLCDRSNFILPEHRNIGLVFQDYALFPHLTALQNVRLAMAKSQRNAEAWLEVVGLGGLAGRMPDQLSGGQQQRVAIARSLAAAPEVLLLDEPFSNIDESLKFHFRLELRDILRNENMTAVFVTHDTKDALAVADRIVVLKNGEIRQTGTPAEIYDAPNDTYVAGLLGPYNLIEQHENHATIIRAEHCIGQLSNDQYSTQGIVQRAVYQGGHYLVEAKTDQGNRLCRMEHPPGEGEKITIEMPKSHFKTVTVR